jgi:hypothetical protein
MLDRRTRRRRLRAAAALRPRARLRTTVPPRPTLAAAAAAAAQHIEVEVVLRGVSETAPNGCLIEAPWLVYGGHGASLTPPFGSPPS